MIFVDKLPILQISADSSSAGVTDDHSIVPSLQEGLIQYLELIYLRPCLVAVWGQMLNVR